MPSTKMFEKSKYIFRLKYRIFIFATFLVANKINSQDLPNFYVQHIQEDIARTGGTSTLPTAVSSLNSAFALANNNRKVHGGRSDANAGNREGDDMAGARQLTATNTLTYYRESASNNSNMRFNTSVWEYKGLANGPDEFKVIGRYAVILNGTANSVTQLISGITTGNTNKCIPFINGIMNNDTGNGANSATAVAYLENSTTLRVQKGTLRNNVTVYITLVEFTGSNWTVLHGDSANTSGDSGSITLYDGSDGTGTATDVSDWSESIIFGQFRGDTANVNEAISDLWPLLNPGSDNQTVDWSFNSGHDSNGTNRHFVHVLNNSGMSVTRFQNTNNNAGERTIDITSAGLSDINQALIVGSSFSSGNGTAYGRGWRNYYLNSTTQAAHWSHRSGNTMSHEIQIVDLAGLFTPDTDDDGVYDVDDVDDDNDGISDATEGTGDTDGDGVIDSMDLDDDNDGIPTIVELGITDTDKDGTLLEMGTLNDSSNSNGIDDSYEVAAGGTAVDLTTTTADFDQDGVPNHLDLDSDNDGVFDVLEYDGLGDLDINGDGVADSLDTDEDGIVNLKDTSSEFGFDPSGTLYSDPLRSGDGVDDYKDLDSNNDSTFDIPAIYTDAVLAATDFDTDDDGIIDGSGDSDGDGILNVFDTDDAVFGSPRNLDDSYTLFFDGRNDYVEESSVIDGWANATIMAFVKLSTSDTGSRIIVGQDEFYLQVNNDETITINANGTTISSTTTIPDDIWTHIAAIYDSGNGELTLYINGVSEDDTTISGSLPSDTSSLTIGRTPDADSNYFEGQIDEIRIFDIALTEKELQRVVYQELDDANSFDSGKIIPMDISSTSIGGDLIRYYKMDGYNDDILDDKTTGSLDTSGAKMYNFKDIYFQTAPLPYETIQDGDWTLTGTWLHGDVWEINTKSDNPNDASIVHIKHNVDLNGTYDTQGTVGLILDSGSELIVEDDKGLFNSWYLELDGTIDLQGESQLIQTEDSQLDVSSAGKIERDQQGTQNSFTYNYWSSPVSLENTSTNNETFTLEDVLNNGTNPTSPVAATFCIGYNCADNATINTSTRWLYKYLANENAYANWIFIGSDGDIEPTQGFSMKGTVNSAAITDPQNYVFIGKPNNAPDLLSDGTTNGDLVHATFSSVGDVSLAGNPFPSAMDADVFIDDNIGDVTNSITGEIFYWEHWSNNSHFTTDYQGGYATYTKAGGVPAVAHPNIMSGGTARNTPGQYIPVGQGFFVEAYDTEDVVFRNSQRVFIKEDPSTTPLDAEHSVFVRQSNSNTQSNSTIEKQRIWFGFETPEGYHRQLLIAFIEGASDGFDIGYDGKAADELSNDVFLRQDDKDYVILAYGEFDEEREIPIKVTIDEDNNNGIQKFMIDNLSNISEDIDIFIKDNLTQTTHNIKDHTFEIPLETGEYLDRFSIVFRSQQSLSVEENEFLDNQLIAFVNNDKSVITLNKTSEIEVTQVVLFNTIGQEIQSWNNSFTDNKIDLHLDNVSTGAYILKIVTPNKNISRKLIVE